jgi:hypothetical protein
MNHPPGHEKAARNQAEDEAGGLPERRQARGHEAEVPPVGEELEDFFAEIDKAGKRALSEQEIIKEIQAYRRKREREGAEDHGL